MRVWSRTASISAEMHRLRARLRMPSEERTSSARASGVKVLCPSPARSNCASRHKQRLAAVVPARVLDPKGVAEDTQRVAVGMQRAVDDRGDHAFGLVSDERLLDDALTGAGLAEHQAQAALLGVNQQRVEDRLLMGQQRGLLDIERHMCEAEV